MESELLDLSEYQKIFEERPGVPFTTIRLALIGYPATGKTAFLKRFTESVFPIRHEPTEQVQVVSELVRTPNGRIFEVFLFEIPGQIQYIELKRLFSAEIDGLIYMFAHHYPYSYTKLDHLIGFAEHYFLGDKHKLIVGNSFTERENVVPPYEAYDYCGERGYDYLRINIRDEPKGVDEAVGYFISKFL